MIVVAYLWKEEKALRTSCSKAHKEKIFFAKWKFKKKIFWVNVVMFWVALTRVQGFGIFWKSKKCRKKCLHNSNKRFINPLEGSEYWSSHETKLHFHTKWIETKFCFLLNFLCVDFDDKENLKDFLPGGGIASLSMSFNVT